MRVSRIYTDQPLSALLAVSLEAQKSHYITQVLRLKVNQTLILFNGIDPYNYTAKITKLGKSVDVFIESVSATQFESPIQTTLYQALSKNEHIDLSIQKCTELGVNAVVIFNSERTQIPLKKSKVDKKLLHWQRIAQSACEQCGRSIVPSIQFMPKFSNTLELTASKLRILLDFEGAAIETAINTAKPSGIDILLGAEGGLSNNEILLAAQCNFTKVRIGPRILRTETAAISAMSLVQLLAGDFN